MGNITLLNMLDALQNRRGILRTSPPPDGLANTLTTKAKQKLILKKLSRVVCVGNAPLLYLPAHAFVHALILCDAPQSRTHRQLLALRSFSKPQEACTPAEPSTTVVHNAVLEPVCTYSDACAGSDRY